MPGSGFIYPEDPQPKLTPQIAPAPVEQSLAKRRFDQFLRQHATWVVYIRAKHDIACSRCEVDLGYEGSADCIECLGTGHPVTVERAPVILAKSRPASMPEGDKLPGLVTDANFRMYYAREFQPQQGDFVLEVEWSCRYEQIPAMGEPVGIIHVYKLEQVEPIYDGSIAFFATGAEVYDHLKPLIHNSLFNR